MPALRPDLRKYRLKLRLKGFEPDLFTGLFWGPRALGQAPNCCHKF